MNDWKAPIDMTMDNPNITFYCSGVAFNRIWTTPKEVAPRLKLVTKGLGQNASYHQYVYDIEHVRYLAVE